MSAEGAAPAAARPVYSWYSVDASVMIGVGRACWLDLLSPVWEELARLAAEGRWRVYEFAAMEVHEPNKAHTWLKRTQLR